MLVELDAGVERAQLASAEARRDLAERTAKRSAVLAQGNVISHAQLDEVEAQLRTAHTDTAGLKAQVDRKVVRAPFKGRLGIRAVNLGQYLTPGTTITTLDAIGATFVDFTLPQEDLALVNVGMPVRVTFEGSTEKAEGDDLRRRSDRRPDHPQRQDPRAPCPNQDAKPRPGMFVNVQVIQPKQQAVVAVPLTAIVHASFGDSVFVVEPKKPGSPGHGQDARRQAGQDRPPAVRAARSRRAATSWRSPRASRPGRRSSPPARSSCATTRPSSSTTPSKPDAGAGTPRPRTADMWFTDVFMRRPVLAIVVNLVIIIAGLQAVRTLNVRQYPRSRARRSPSRPSTSAPAPIWCAASSPRRSSARSRRPTASTTSSRRASRASRRSTSA